MGLIIASVALGVLVSVQGVQRDAQLRNALTRDTQLVVDSVTSDLKYLGAGVPRGRQLYVPGKNQFMRPAIRIAAADYIAFLGDAPMPNADLNGSAVLVDVGPTSPPNNLTDHRLAVASELSGCAPPKGGSITSNQYTCDTRARGFIDTGSLAQCHNGSATAASCPWGLGKWEAEDNTDPVVGTSTAVYHLIIGAPNGSWVRREFKGNRFEVDFSDFLSLHAEHAYPPGSSIPNGAQVSSIERNDFLAQRAGTPSIAQVDRLFLSVEGGVLWRRQCWGWGASLDPDDANFPSAAHAPIRATDPPTDIADCLPPDKGTAWEPIVTGIKTFRFRYFQQADPDVELTPPLNLDALADVMFIEVEVTIEKTVPGSSPGTHNKMSQTLTRRVFLENGGGRFEDTSTPPDGVNDLPAAQGGCETKLSCGRDQ